MNDAHNQTGRQGRFAQIALVVLLGGAVTAVLAFAFVPGLRDTATGRAIRFWETVPPPPPAVPPGQLGEEMKTADESGTNTALVLAPDIAEQLGLETSEAVVRTPEGGIVTTGRIATDERRRSVVTSKVEGWIEKTFVDFEGQNVKAGQPLFSFYSPELVATQEEYLLARRAERDFAKSDFDVVRDSGPSLAAAARRRLELWDVSPEQIAEIEKSGKALRTLTVYAKTSGVVTERKAYPNMRITPDEPLYSLADLSTVWVEADVFESDLPNVKIGTAGEIAAPGAAIGTAPRTARVTFIAPTVDPETRTARVRLELSNPRAVLKPGMFVDVKLATAARPELVVPRDAVLDTGTRKLVMIGRSDGSFEILEIHTGAEGSDYYSVTSGLAAGDRVARRIQFLLDSETDLRARVEQQFPVSPAAGAGGSQPARGSAPAMPEGHVHP
ncbi:MAG: efflux RND transporter periplasmic adaptor subunit [Acidobacteria bacterium]|nr:efflux RND transporter periplasmic adaptor subunit [Acidobacteriota bacterium]